MKYDFELNNKKVSQISYDKINRSSKLINYFSNIHFSQTIKVNDFLKLFNSFYATADEEFLSDVKGSKKIILCIIAVFF